jgi:aspartate-semialdehyde dehydrogenase
MATRTSPSTHALSVALIEPATLLGKDVRAVLKERSFPTLALHLFQSHAAEGFLTADDEEAAFVAPLSPDALEACHLAFFCGRASDTERFLKARGDDGCLVIDLSGVRAGGPFVVPAGNGETPLPDGNLFLTYDPVSAVLAETVRVVDALSPVEAVTAAIDRTASELGPKALDELFQQSIALAAFRPIPKDVFHTQAAFNVFYPEDTEVFDARVAEDFARILACEIPGREIPLSVLSARAGIFHGHHLRLDVQLRKQAPPAAAIREAFRKHPEAFEEADPENFSGSVESVGRDETLLLHVSSSGRSVRLGLAADPLRRTGAIMAVRIAEQVVRDRGLLADA